MNYHRKPETEADCKKILAMNYKQSEESVNIIEKITCICGERVEPFFMFRCYFCGLWLCAKCAKEHFGERPKYKNAFLTPQVNDCKECGTNQTDKRHLNLKGGKKYTDGKI